MNVHFGSLNDGLHGRNHVIMYIFKNHPLYDESFIYVQSLEEQFKYNMNSELPINYWAGDKFKTREKKIRLKDLLTHSPEVHEFASRYFPEHVL